MNRNTATDGSADVNRRWRPSSLSKTVPWFGSYAELPSPRLEAVWAGSVSPHHRYDMEAEILVDGDLILHIPAAWRRKWLPHCPDGGLRLVNDVFPVDQSP